MLISFRAPLRFAADVCRGIFGNSIGLRSDSIGPIESGPEVRLTLTLAFPYHIQLLPHGAPFPERGRHLRDDRVLHRDDRLELPANTPAGG